MILTGYGVAIAVLALCLMGLRSTALMKLALFASILGAASALDLPALGGSSVQPAQFALLFLGLRLVFSRMAHGPRIGYAIAANRYLVAFCSYGIAGAFVLPVIFAGDMAVFPLRPPAFGSISGLVPLAFTPQNITTAFYLLGTMVMAVTATLIARFEKGRPFIVSVAVAIALVHAGFGILDGVLTHVGRSDALDVLRNASYTQHNQGVDGFKRLAGTFSEASAFANFGFPWLIFLVELWLRQVRPAATGWAALVLGCVLLLSTSSTAYVSLGAYALLLLLRLFCAPTRLPFRKTLQIAGWTLGAIVLVLLIVIVDEKLWRTFSGIVHTMTVDKLDSNSGVQRTSWALQGLDAFVVSYGLGIGPGSFRSSSLLTAIIGSVGAFGLFAFMRHVFKCWRPFAKSTYDVRRAPLDSVAVAAGWAATAGLIPAMIVAPACDPGMLFGFFSGYALGLRGALRAEPSLAHRPRMGSATAQGVPPVGQPAPTI